MVTCIKVIFISYGTIFINGFPQFDKVFGSYNSSGQLAITYLVALQDGDAVSFRNYISGTASISIPEIIGGTERGVNVEAVFDKIAPYPVKLDECACVPKEPKCEDKKETKKEHRLRRKFNIIKKWMKCDPQLNLYGTSACGSFYSTLEQDIVVGGSVLYQNSLNVNNLTYVNGSGDITVQQAGIYLYMFVVETAQACQFSVFVNGVIDPTTTAGINKGANVLQLRQEFELKAGDVISIRNHTSANGTVKISNSPGGTLSGVNTQLILVKIGLPTTLQENFKKESACILEKDCKYKLFKEFLLEDKTVNLFGYSAYCLLNSTNLVKLNLEESVHWNFKGEIKNCLFKSESDVVTVNEAGIYVVNFDFQAKQPTQFTIYINDVPNVPCIAGTDSGSGQVSIRQLVALNKGDVLSVKNHSSFLNPITSVMNPGGNLTGINSLFVAKRLGPIPSTKPCKPCKP